MTPQPGPMQPGPSQYVYQDLTKLPPLPYKTSPLVLSQSRLMSRAFTHHGGDTDGAHGKLGPGGRRGAPGLARNLSKGSLFQWPKAQVWLLHLVGQRSGGSWVFNSGGGGGIR